MPLLPEMASQREFGYLVGAFAVIILRAAGVPLLSVPSAIAMCTVQVASLLASSKQGIPMSPSCASATSLERFRGILRRLVDDGVFSGSASTFIPLALAEASRMAGLGSTVHMIVVAYLGGSLVKLVLSMAPAAFPVEGRESTPAQRSGLSSSATRACRPEGSGSSPIQQSGLCSQATSACRPQGACGNGPRLARSPYHVGFWTNAEEEWLDRRKDLEQPEQVGEVMEQERALAKLSAEFFQSQTMDFIKDQDDDDLDMYDPLSILD